jgi:hypothetical protein
VVLAGEVSVAGASAGASVVVSVVAVCANDATGTVNANAAQRGRMFKYLFMLSPNQLNLQAFTMPLNDCQARYDSFLSRSGSFLLISKNA